MGGKTKLTSVSGKTTMYTAAWRAFASGTITPTVEDSAGSVIVQPECGHARPKTAPIVAVVAVLAWLDTGRPDPEAAADHVRRAVAEVIESVKPAG